LRGIIRIGILGNKAADKAAKEATE
jgi:hypothetical protein